MGALGSLVSLWIAHQSSVEDCCASICLTTWWSLFSKTICLYKAVRLISCRVLFLATRTCQSRRPSLSNQRYWPYSSSPIQLLANHNLWPQSTDWIREEHVSLGWISAILECKSAGLLLKDRVCKASIHPVFILSASSWMLKKFQNTLYLLLSTSMSAFVGLLLLRRASHIIAWTGGQTLGLGLGQSKDIVVVFY